MKCNYINNIFYLLVVIIFSLNNYISYCKDKITSNEDLVIVKDSIISFLGRSLWLNNAISDTLLDVNNDGILDTIEQDDRNRGFSINSQYYFSIYTFTQVYLLNIKNKIYYFDLEYPDCDSCINLSTEVLEIQKDFTSKKVIEFQRKDNIFIKNKVGLNPNTIINQFLDSNKLLQCNDTKLIVNEDNYLNYNFFSHKDEYFLNESRSRGEIIINGDTIVCLAIYNGSNNPFSIEYLRFHSDDFCQVVTSNKLFKSIIEIVK